MTKLNKYIIGGALIVLLLTATKVSAEKLISKYEGLRLQSYLDPAGIWTIGYGTVINPDTKKRIKEGDTITQAQAIEWLKKETSKVRTAVKRLIKVPVTENQLVALTSFAYNVGTTALADSTLLKKLNAKKPKTETAAEFDRWVYAKGKKLPGLIRRRKEEKELFLS